MRSTSSTCARIAAIYFGAKYGPPAVDMYFGPTIQYVAGTFHAIAPHPAPPTAFMHTQTPIAPRPTPNVSMTIFVQQIGYETMPTPMTGVEHNQWPLRTHQDPSNSSTRGAHSERDGIPKWYSLLDEWYSHTIHEATHAILSHLRRLFDNFYFQVAILTAPILSWRLLECRNQVSIENLKKLHEHKIAGIYYEMSALTTSKDVEISLLVAENKSQRDQLGVQTSVLNEAKGEARLANEAKSSTEERSETDTAELNARIKDRDTTMAELNARIKDRDTITAERDRSLDTAEATNVDLVASLTRVKADANEAELRAMETPEFLQQRNVELETLHQEKLLFSDTSAAKSDFPAQEESLLPKLNPSTSSNFGQKSLWHSGTQLLPMCKPPTDGKTNTPSPREGFAGRCANWTRGWATSRMELRSVGH